MNILIIGLRKNHAEIIKKEFKSFNFTMITEEDNHKYIHNLKPYDCIISLWRFTNHQTEYSCSKHPNYHRVRSYTMVKRLLETFQI